MHTKCSRIGHQGSDWLVFTDEEHWHEVIESNVGTLTIYMIGNTVIIYILMDQIRIDIMGKIFS